MPIYEYRCNKCGHELEEIQKFSDAPLKTCPECGKAALKKLISAAGFRLSGSGWYETDFKSDKKKNLAEKDSKEAGKDKDDKGGGDKDKGDKKDKKETTSSKESKSSKETKKSSGGDSAAASNS